MDYIDEFNKFLKSYFDDKTKQLMQGFELMASQLRGKLAAGGSKSFIMERHIRPFLLNNFMIVWMDIGTTMQMGTH